MEGGVTGRRDGSGGKGVVEVTCDSRRGEGGVRVLVCFDVVLIGELEGRQTARSQGRHSKVCAPHIITMS
jgi:hypothetical protein